MMTNQLKTVREAKAVQPALFLLIVLAIVRPGWADRWDAACRNGEDAQKAIRFCRRYANGWLMHVDPATGLFPRTINGGWFWNGRDCAADNFPFFVLTAYVTDDYHLKRAAMHILEQEKRLTSRIDGLPDVYDFEKQGFRSDAIDGPDLIFDAAEYAKDGLMPMTERLGPGPWLDRMQELMHGIWKHAEVPTPGGPIPSSNVEVNGDLLQVMSRLYWITRDARYKEWCYRIADAYLVHQNMLDQDSIWLRDHGCEILGGLSETYFITTREDPDRRATYQRPLRAILDCILEKGVNEDGMMPDSFNPKTGETSFARLSDSWGYVYDAFLTVSLADDEPRYEQAVVHALRNIHKYLNQNWDNNSADGYADSIESALNLLNRLPTRSGFRWVDESIEYIYAKQRDDGLLEAWYGDGNSARTSLLYAFWKTQGAMVSPWRNDVRFGASRGDDGAVYLSLSVDWEWHGRLRMDRPRHRDYLGMPADYARINQFPEWFTAEEDAQYAISIDDGTPKAVSGRDLLDYPLTVAPKGAVRILLRPLLGEEYVAKDYDSSAWRTQAFIATEKEVALAWQVSLRDQLFKAMKIDDLVMQQDTPDLAPEVVSSEDRGLYTLTEMTINSTPKRRMPILVTMPKHGRRPLPAVVCIHGHGGDRHIVYDPESVYKGFAKSLAEAGFVTIATDIGWHEVHDAERTLAGERLWDLMRCIDYLECMPEVGKDRIGCAGLSLGGEMAMWLGAMDRRVKATVSAGFLTVMDQMERQHCMCWKFDGLRALVDFPDVYSLVAPRSLQCQIGVKEPLSQFNIVQARYAYEQILPIYRLLEAPDHVALDVHDGEHVVDVPKLMEFFRREL